jgi:hypothetical protein
VRTEPMPRWVSGCVLVIASLVCLTAWSQDRGDVSRERSFPYSAEIVRKGLDQVGAWTGGKLPMVDGFVSAAVPQVERYQRPYYQYRIQLNPVDPSHTSVRVEARISAWYADPEPFRSQYSALVSNGRLEEDLLDRLQDALKTASEMGAPLAKASTAAPPVPDPTSSLPAPPAAVRVPQKQPAPGRDAATPEQRLDALLAQRQAVREKTAATQAEIDQLKSAKAGSSETAKLASVKRSGVGVMTRKNFGGPVLFRAQAEDEFEVISLESGWAQVRLTDNSTAYIQADELNLPQGMVEQPAVAAVTAASAQAGKAADPDLDFWVSHEDVNVFSGDWAKLKGKKVLFVYAQPRGVLSDMAGDEAKLAYAKRVFGNRYRSGTQTGQIEGVVVVFMGAKGGVAAATLTDIRQWVEGGLGDEAFVNRCSLDPPAEFRRIHLD